MEEETENPHSKIFRMFSILILILIVFNLLVFYWFVPFKSIDFGTKSGNANFSLNVHEKNNMQFYPMMRFPDSKISYQIGGCPLQKKDDMERAFEIISNKSLLEFYSVNFGEEISVTCDSKNKIQDGMFIAGEGGPVNISEGEKFNIIFNGQVLLLKESSCYNPNIAIHELLHVLGFNHSTNKNNIMYPVSNCRQTIGQDTLDLINELYSIPSYADLSFENVSAYIHGRYLDTEINIRNIGLKDSEEIEIEIYTEDKLIKQISLEALEIGNGMKITMNNIRIPRTDIVELQFVINSSFEELEKENNKITLEIRNELV